MKQHGGHKLHMSMMAGIVIVALLVGVGAGGAFALALLACTAMMVAMVWMMSRSMNHSVDRPGPVPIGERGEEPLNTR